MTPLISFASRRFGLFTALFSLLLATPRAVQAHAPRLGEVQRIRAITLSLRVGSTDKDSRQVTYTPPPGWYVLSHAVHCTKQYGNASYSVSTIPEDWDWFSEEQAKQSYKALLDVAGRAQEVGLETKYDLNNEAVLQALRRVRSARHALVVDASAQGEGFLRGGSGLDMTVTAELVYLGPVEEPVNAAAATRTRAAAVRPARLLAPPVPQP
jgi:hypothetical protein